MFLSLSGINSKRKQLCCLIFELTEYDKSYRSEQQKQPLFDFFSYTKYYAKNILIHQRQIHWYKVLSFLCRHIQHFE